MRLKILALLLLLSAVPIGVSALSVTVGTRIRGNLSITGSLSKGSGSFFIDHPLDPKDKLLFHSFVESPEVKNLYDGIATLDESGEARIRLPHYFEALNADFRYQLFALYRSMPDLYVKQEVKDNEFVISGGVPGGEVSWQVTGNRHDPYIKRHPIINEVPKSDSAIVKQGECLHEPLCE